jgi:hypothetical protein
MSEKFDFSKLKGMLDPKKMGQWNHRAIGGAMLLYLGANSVYRGISISFQKE